jgi:transcriptional regulator with XRE-family HTH domain
MGKILSGDEIGYRLRVMRQKAGLSQEQLAEMLAITSQQIQKYESGKSKLNTDRLQQVAQALSVPLMAFFTDQDGNIPIGNSERVLIESYRAIRNQEVQESVLKIVVHAAK